MKKYLKKDELKAKFIKAKQNESVDSPIKIEDFILPHLSESEQQELRKELEELIAGEEEFVRLVKSPSIDFDVLWREKITPSLVELPIDEVRKQATDYERKGDLVGLEMLKQRILTASNRGEILLAFANKEESLFQSIAEFCIVEVARRGDKDTVQEVLTKLNKTSAQARLLAIRAAADAGVYGDPTLLAPISTGNDCESLRQAVTQALYRIWRKDERERALRLMQEMAKSVTPWMLIRGKTSPLIILLDVTLRTLGLLHDKVGVVRDLVEFWRDLLTRNLYLRYQRFPMKWISSIIRWAILNIASRQAAKKLEGFGISIGDFTDSEKEAIHTLMDALTPGNKEAFAKIPQVIENFGLGTTDEKQRTRTTAVIVELLLTTICAVQAKQDFADTVKVFDKIFENSERLHNRGRITRFFVYSSLNYAIQVHYPTLGPEKLEPGLKALLRYYRWSLKNDPESLTEIRPSGRFGLITIPFGIFSQSVICMGNDLNDEIIQPMLVAAKQGHTNLVKAYLRGSAFCLDTFSRRFSAHDKFLESLVLFDVKDLANHTGIDIELLRQWVAESYAIISVGFPSNVEEFLRQDPGFLSRIRQARSQPSELLNTISTNITLEHEMNRILELWGIADGGNTLMVLFPQLRQVLIGYIKKLLEYNSLKDLIQDGMTELITFLISGRDRKE